MPQPITPSATSPQELVKTQHDFFKLGYTRDVDYRLRRLQDLRRAIEEQQDQLLRALQVDLGKPPFEAVLAELEFCLLEIDHALKHLRSWTKPRSVGLPVTLWPGRAKVQREPLGVVLIMGAWNYPVQLTLGPLVGAIAAGNCAVIKPSEVAPQSSRAIADLIRRAFDPMYVAVAEGGIQVSQALLEEPFDHIFYTGGPTVAKVVMAYAAQRLTPVTLELGGKNPCILDRSADFPIAARRIVWGKFFNAGQSCLAPDYVLVPRDREAEFLALAQAAITDFFGPTPSLSPDFARIANDYHLERLLRLIPGSGQVVIGGDADPRQRYLAPTLLAAVQWSDPVMQEEIFGPILPVLAYDHLDGAIAQINARPHPLACYVFTNDRTISRAIGRETTSGSLCVNDLLVQATVPDLPFGGVGASGMGRYHGRAGFELFSYQRSHLWRSAKPEFPMRYPPYDDNKLSWLSRLRS